MVIFFPQGGTKMHEISASDANFSGVWALVDSPYCYDHIARPQIFPLLSAVKVLP